MDTDHETLLYYTAIRWLSNGNVVTFFFELRTEIKLFLEMIEKDAFVDFFKDKTWLLCLVFLADITEQLNKFNLRLQGPDTDILQFGDILRGFIKKIGNWNHRFNQVLKTYLDLILVSVHSQNKKLRHIFDCHARWVFLRLRCNVRGLNSMCSMHNRNNFSSPEDTNKRHKDMR